MPSFPREPGTLRRGEEDSDLDLLGARKSGSWHTEKRSFQEKYLQDAYASLKACGGKTSTYIVWQEHRDELGQNSAKTQASQNCDEKANMLLLSSTYLFLPCV